MGEWGGEEQCLDGWWVSGVGRNNVWMDGMDGGMGEWGGDEQCLDGWWVSVWMDGG